MTESTRQNRVAENIYAQFLRRLELLMFAGQYAARELKTWN